MSPEAIAAFECTLRAAYQMYIDNFDPSPQNYGDGYSTPPDFETWVIEQEDDE